MKAWVVSLVRIGAPLALLLLVVVPTAGALIPSENARTVAGSYPDELHLLIAWRGHYSSSGLTEDQEITSRYLLMPSLKVVTVSQQNDSAPAITENPLGLILHVFLIVFALTGTWWFWIRRWIHAGT